MIKLNIKSPTSAEDKCLETTLDATVQEVKCQIELEWPSHPPPKDQRLVYAGKLLENASILKQVLRLEDARDENDAFTIHLVCRITNTNHSTSSESLQSSNELRKRNIQNQQPLESNPANPASQNLENNGAATSSALSAPAGWNQDQAAVMHQLYANYMTQYVQYLQSIGAMSSWPPSAAQSLVEHTNQIAEEAQVNQPPIFDPVAAAAVAGAMANNLQQPQQQQPQPVAQPQNRAALPGGIEDNNNLVEAGGPNGPNVVLNAGAGGIGAMEDDDDLGNGGQRDVLDWCYVITRVLVLFSIVYFYSSLARFTLAFGLGIIFYLYNNGFFGQNHNQNENHEAAVDEVRQVAGAAGDRVNNENEVNNEDTEGNEDNNDEESAAAAVVQPVDPPAPHPLTILHTFVTTFFTSLLPNDPQVV